MPAAFGPPEQPPDVRLAVRAWNLLGGVEWAGIELVAETLGYTDLELLMHQLVVIRERQRDD